MLGLLCRKLARNIANSTHHYTLLRPNPFLKPISDQIPYFRYISILSNNANEQSLTLSYLKSACGLSLESALSASGRINFKTTRNADAVLGYFKSIGFTDSQIANIVSIFPHLLASGVENNLQPKLEFFRDLGLSKSEIGELIASSPKILLRSLESQIKPSINFLRNLVSIEGDRVKVLRSWISITAYGSFGQRTKPCISLLQEYGMLESQIAYIIIHLPRIIIRKTDSLREILERANDLGFERGSAMFVLAVRAMNSMKLSSWRAKLELLKSRGWSEDEIRSAFLKMPTFLSPSEKKIKTLMDFYVKELKWAPSVVASRPMFLMYSLENRLIPRRRVWEILKNKGLVTERELKHMFNLSEQEFLQRYITKHEKELPDLLKAYRRV